MPMPPASAVGAKEDEQVEVELHNAERLDLSSDDEGDCALL